MERRLLKISYIGDNYCGWQFQPNAVSVQQAVGEALQKAVGFKTNVTGCSRTDSGVHAIEYFCHFDGDFNIDCKTVVNAVNFYLPPDIRCLDCKTVDSDFHARYSCKGKNYIYKIYNSQIMDPFLINRVWHIKPELNIESMNEFCSALCGTHDFSSFCSAGTTVSDFVRTVTECKVFEDGNLVTISVSADGFLYNMVRIIAGTAVYVSQGKIAPSDALLVIDAHDREKAGITAPPQGLYLNRVFY